MDRHSSDGYEIVEACVYVRKRFHAIFGMLSGGEFEHSAVRCPLSALRSLLPFSHLSVL